MSGSKQHTDTSSLPAPVRVSHESLVQLLDISPDALLVVGEAGTILIANEQAEKLFGYARGKLSGQPLIALIPERFQEGHNARFDRYFLTPQPRLISAESNLSGKGKDGSEFPVDINLRPVLLDKALCVIGAVRNVTEQVRARRQLEALAETIKQKQERLELAQEAGRIGLFEWNMQADELAWMKEEDPLPGMLSGTYGEKLKDWGEQDTAYSRSGWGGDNDILAGEAAFPASLSGGKLELGEDTVASEEQRNLVLAVDDDPDVIALIRTSLRDTPYSVIGVQDPLKLIELQNLISSRRASSRASGLDNAEGIDAVQVRRSHYRT